jgi:hypothetical protein
MDMVSIIARVASGFAVKAAAFAAACYVASYVYSFVVQAFAPIAGVL